MLSVCAPIRMRIAIVFLFTAWLSAPTARAQAPPMTGFAHAAFRVGNLEKTREFYGKLGFEQAFEFSDAGKTTVAFIKINDRQFIELYPRSEDHQTVGLMHVCYEASDILAVHDAYAKLDLNPSEVKKARAGNLLFVVHDPEGQLVEYTQYEPGSLHSLDRGKHLGAERVSESLIGVKVAVRGVAAERSFYIEKLGFASSSRPGLALQLPGHSGDVLELEPAATAIKPEITFLVDNAKQTAKMLRRRGLAVQTRHGEISVSDPEGVLAVFQQVRN
jgi:catechol 2,3-dioxygenase-like lactoylglutathione lyase family enzyme